MAGAVNSEQLSNDRKDRENGNGERGIENQEAENPDLLSSHGSKAGNVNGGEADEEKPKKPSKLKEIWSKIGLDIGTVMMMFK